MRDNCPCLYVHRPIFGELGLIKGVLKINHYNGKRVVYFMFYSDKPLFPLVIIAAAVIISLLKVFLFS